MDKDSLIEAVSPETHTAPNVIRTTRFGTAITETVTSIRNTPREHAATHH